MSTIHKLFNTKVTSVNDEDSSVEFIISTDEVDRYGDVVDQDSWNFKSYETNPIVLWGHDPSVPENVLGNGGSFSQIIENGVKKTKARISFATDVNQKAAMIYEMVKRGILRTVSVGFVPHTTEYQDDVPVLKDNELLEISVVPIPANAGAVALGLKAGELNTKDAKWLLESMRKEADLIDAQIKAAKPQEKKKSMTDEQAQALIDGIANLTKTVEAQQAVIDELKAQADEKAKAEEAAAAKAAEEAEAAKKQAEDAEAAKKQAEEEAAAKPGDDDQGGAGDEPELDDDAELTPEQEAELNQEFQQMLEEAGLDVPVEA